MEDESTSAMESKEHDRASLRLSDFNCISSLDHPKVERLRVALDDERFIDALIHAWTLFEVKARAMWNDNRIHGVLRADFASRDIFPPLPRSNPMTVGSVEFEIRESNKLHNHKVLEMFAKLSPEVAHGHKKRRGISPEQRKHAEIERYLTEALIFPVRDSQTQEENGSGYVFTNVLAPFVLGDVEDDRHRWLDEARLIRNADLHGTECSIELLSRHVRVVLELTELISTWEWK